FSFEGLLPEFGLVAAGSLVAGSFAAASLAGGSFAVASSFAADSFSLDFTGLRQALGVLPATYGGSGRFAEMVVVADRTVGVVAECDEVPVELAHVGAIAHPFLQRAIGGHRSVHE